MKEIKINSLILENFKKHSYLALNFDGQSVTIYGRNETGKSNVYDGFAWLLFGKTSTGEAVGEKGVQIKPVNEMGEVLDHQAITAVEAVLLVNGEEITLRRELRETWTTHRGSTEAVYSGDTTKYFYDGIPMKKNAYDAAVRELVPEELFRCLTDLFYFTTKMKWQECRATLFDMAGMLSDQEIMERDQRFAPLMDSLGKLTLTDYKAKLLHQRKGLTGVRDDTPTRINECQRTLNDISGIDFQEAREQEQELVGQKDSLQVQLLALDQDTVVDKKRLALREAKFQRDQLEAQNRAYRDSQKAAGPDLGHLRREISLEKDRIESNRTFLVNTQRIIQRYEEEIQRSRDKYVQVNGEAFAGGICPTCGQALPFEQLQEATRVFNLKKEERLAAIIAQADRQKEEMQQAQHRAADIETEIRQRQDRIEALEDQIRNAQAPTVVITDMEGYAQQLAEINGCVDALQVEINGLMSDSSKVREQLRAELKAVEDQLRFTLGVLAKEGIKAQTEKRIEELKADARNAAEALENIEAMLYLMEEFTRYKAGFLEETVNDHFHITTFRLFRKTLDNGIEDRCDVLCRGVAFNGLNTATQYNVGIDIVNALSRYYGVSVPLFVDNAESINRLENANTQVIRLKVTDEDKELRIE